MSQFWRQQAIASTSQSLYIYMYLLVIASRKFHCTFSKYHRAVTAKQRKLHTHGQDIADCTCISLKKKKKIAHSFWVTSGKCVTIIILIPKLLHFQNCLLLTMQGTCLKTERYTQNYIFMLIVFTFDPG